MGSNFCSGVISNGKDKKMLANVWKFQYTYTFNLPFLIQGNLNSIILRTYNCCGVLGGGERTMFFVYTSSKAVLAKVFECESQISILVDKFSQSHLLVKMYNWHYGKMHFSSSLDCIANCASIYRHLYITALLYLGGESTFKFYWKLNFIISALIMHVLKKCTQIGENVLSQHKFGGAVQFCFDPFQGWGGC